MKKLLSAFLFATLLMPAWVNAETTHKHEHSHHGKQETSAYAAIPSIKLGVKKDSASGWNLHLMTENFTFTPENIDQAKDEPEGHAHVYVDGEKIARIYGPWFHLSGLTPGAHTIRVSLNANDHSEFVLNGEPIEAIEEVVEP